MKTDAEIASELVTRICSNYRTVGAAMYDEPRERLCLAITAALAAARAVPDGYVRVGTTDHRLLGTLPMTADGCVVGDWASVYISGPATYDGRGTARTLAYVWVPDVNNQGMAIRRGHEAAMCYSSLAAATAARDAGKGGTAP